MYTDVIEGLLRQHGMKRSQMEKDLGLPPSFLTEIKSGRTKRPNAERLARIAQYFDVSVDYLLGNSPYPREEDASLARLGAKTLDPDDAVDIPIMGQVAAGLGCLAENQVEGYEKTLNCSINPKEKYIYLQVKGDSMSPLLNEDDLVLVKCESSIDSGCYAVVTVDGEDGVVKKVVYGKDWIELHSENPYYPVRRFEGEDVLRIRVVGRVIESKRKF